MPHSHSTGRSVRQRLSAAAFENIVVVPERGMSNISPDNLPLLTAAAVQAMHAQSLAGKSINRVTNTLRS